MIKNYTEYKGGIRQVNLNNQTPSIPDSIDFRWNENHCINVNFWVVQALRRNVELHYSDYDQTESENKIGFIKALRLNFSIGLKEAKDIAEWFMDNVDRDCIGKI